MLGRDKEGPLQRPVEPAELDARAADLLEQPKRAASPHAPEPLRRVTAKHQARQPDDDEDCKVGVKQ